MATSSIDWVIQHLRKAALLREGAELTDGQLLEGFVSRRETAALEILVQRHAPMVWGVCRRIVQNHHDAEDAFQATFLVLVRRAAAIVPRQMVANWLYGVAHQTALKARATRAKRQTRERQVTSMPEPEAVKRRDLWQDLEPLLDEELSRLPDKYRVAIVLCDLEGKTRKEAAAQLGVPDGTLAARLARARTMLATRLARHGLAVSGGLLGVVLSQKAAVSAAAPASVMASTIKAVISVAAGQATATGLVSAKVVALTEGVLRTMLLTKLKVATAVLLGLGIACYGFSSLTYPASAQQGQAVKPPAEETKAHVSQKDDTSARTPPDLNEGVQIIFGKSSKEQQFGWTDNSKAPVVVRVKGNWVLLKGIEPPGFTAVGECWINFDTVSWYMVVPK
ncbi:MAG TPA: sigma-70 family RNA polymerase sigma factor [Gemmataceae bacterium]|jgi:RNA polymerase sigma factor (sigma-70 family)|nr:sigma-70 family RNA polymerase sigma factor [Gemmataceae bacterium]